MVECCIYGKKYKTFRKKLETGFMYYVNRITKQVIFECTIRYIIRKKDMAVSRVLNGRLLYHTTMPNRVSNM